MLKTTLAVVVLNRIFSSIRKTLGKCSVIGLPLGTAASGLLGQEHAGAESLHWRIPSMGAVYIIDAIHLVEWKGTVRNDKKI